MIFKVFTGIIIFFLAVSNCSAVNTFAQSKSRESEQQMGEFFLSGIGEKGRKNWDVAGKSANISSDVIRLNDIVSNFYGEKDNVRLTAERGDYNQQKGFLHLEKDVIVTTSSGAKLTTETLDWDRNAKLVSTKDPVNIRKQDMTIIAQGAKGYPDLNKVDLEKDVQVEIKSPQNNSQGEKAKEPTVITCDGPLQIDYQKNIAIFNHNVKVVSADILIDSDTMDVYFSASDKNKTKTTAAVDNPALSGSEINKIIARGNVKITQNKNVSYSDEAVYDAAAKKITLSGKPRLVIYSTEGMK